jgi:hypothetical protein
MVSGDSGISLKIGKRVSEMVFEQWEFGVLENVSITIGGNYNSSHFANRVTEAQIGSCFQEHQRRLCSWQTRPLRQVVFQGSYNSIAVAWLVWGWAELAGPQGLLGAGGAGGTGWSCSGSSTLEPLCVLPPASILSTESAQEHFLQLALLNLKKNSFGVFFYWSKNPNSASECLALVSFNCQPLRLAPKLHILLVFKFGWGAVFVFVFGSLGPHMPWS